MTRSTVVVGGMIAASPHQGGATWAVLQYLLGLRRLGFDPWFVERVPSDRIERSQSATYCAQVMDRFGFEDRWMLMGDDGSIAGSTMDRLASSLDRAPLVVDIAGTLAAEPWLTEVDTRLYLDLDPGFVQLWATADGVDMGFAGHTHFATIGDRVGVDPIPDCGQTWIPTLPPVVLEEWPVATARSQPAMTSVAHWRSYGSIHVGSLRLGQKAHSIRRIIDLPRRLDEPVRIALGIHPEESDDLSALASNGWELLDPGEVASGPDTFRDFVSGSWAELGVAKEGYVVTDSGWFSDRSACYLAAGRPVVAEDTGFGRRLPSGAGLFTFRDVADVERCVESLRADYDGQREAARAIAEDHLDSDEVLGSLLGRIGVT